MIILNYKFAGHQLIHTGTTVFLFESTTQRHNDCDNDVGMTTSALSGFEKPTKRSR